MKHTIPTIVSLVVGTLVLTQARVSHVRADEVTDWNQNLLRAALLGNSSPLVSPRSGAIAQTAVFDALNGIERRYTPIHVTAQAPRGASQRAAVIQAAYGTLVKLFPLQKAL